MIDKEMNFDWAAAILWALGEPIPHLPELEERAQKAVECVKDREALVLQTVHLCEKEDTPACRYLFTKLYSLLGPNYAEDTISWASRYLSGEAWEKLPQGMTTIDGIRISREIAARASVYGNLAFAQAQKGEIRAAMANYTEAYRLEPYNAMYPVKIADLLALSGSAQEAVQYLENQKRSHYYKPLSYKDNRGSTQKNDTFRELLDAQIRKLKGRIARREESNYFSFDN